MEVNLIRFNSVFLTMTKGIRQRGTAQPATHLNRAVGSLFKAMPSTLNDDGLDFVFANIFSAYHFADSGQLFYGHLAIKGRLRGRFSIAFWSAACGRNWPWRIRSAQLAPKRRKMIRKKTQNAYRRFIAEIEYELSLAEKQRSRI